MGLLSGSLEGGTPQNWNVPVKKKKLDPLAGTRLLAVRKGCYLAIR
jgi:hypothetical protein